MDLIFYFTAIFVGSILAVIVAIRRHKKEQEEINKIIFDNKEMIVSLNKTIDKINKRKINRR